MGANNADFHGINFSHKYNTKGKLIVLADHPEVRGHVGFLHINPDGETIGNIFVAPDHRRKGVGTAMLNYAKQLGVVPKHSSNRTPEGDAWAKAVGGDLPKNEGILPFD
jgi:GNAT superfamily N-acetyltransferase